MARLQKAASERSHSESMKACSGLGADRVAFAGWN